MKKKEVNKEKIKLNSEKIRERDRKIRVIKIGLLMMIVFLIIIYFILRIVYETGYFTVSLDPSFAKKSGLVMYESIENREERKILKATKVEFMDNISVKWLPDNLNDEADGSHNGEDYLAYTFYLENKGSDPINYWYSIMIDEVIRNVDRAIRIMVYHNGEQKIYAQANRTTGEPEEGTEKFKSDTEIALENRQGMQPGEIDKFTIVVYLEGDDTECDDSLIGGEMKMHMDITEEHITEG